MLSEKSYAQYVDDFEQIAWPPEEAMFLRTIENFDLFYEEVYKHVTTFNIPKLNEIRIF